MPNYAPSGVIRFGSVPWSRDYSNVRLYTGLSEQSSDIFGRMTVSSSNYTYIARNRRLKVAIEADRLYHCNYCMYRNDSLTDGYIYCFVSDVEYVNDGTTEVTLETDVFQTFLYSVDWTIPACYIERATVGSEDERYMYTSEPDFPLVYVSDGERYTQFEGGGWVIMSAAYPEQNDGLIDSLLNPGGYSAEPQSPTVNRGIVNGAGYYFVPMIESSSSTVVTELIEQFVNGLEYAGSVDSIVAIFPVPDFMCEGWGEGWLTSDQMQGSPFSDVRLYIDPPERGDSLDGYTPRNRKLLYYPYTFLRVTDCNGSETELRYELFGVDPIISVKYEVSPACQAFVYPNTYAGVPGTYYGFTTDCGALGSWTNDAYTSWLARNGAMIAVTAAGIALAGISGGTSMAAASATLRSAQTATAGAHAGSAAARASAMQAARVESAQLASQGTKMLAGAGAAAAMGYQTISSAMHQPTATRGQTTPDVRYMGGLQGVFCYRIVAKAEVAEQIDDFFDMWGYAVDRIEEVDITSRPAWNYVKTGGSAPRSTNTGAGSSAPFSRGRGTPADALATIKAAFDGGVTFWHTTGGFGDYSQSNAI